MAFRKPSKNGLKAQLKAIGYSNSQAIEIVSCYEDQKLENWTTEKILHLRERMDAELKKRAKLNITDFFKQIIFKLTK